MRRGELIDRINQCGYDLFNLDSEAIIYYQLRDIGIRVRKSDDDSVPYDVYFSTSLFKLNTALGLSMAERLCDGGQYYFPPDSILSRMPLEDVNAGTIEVDELSTNSTRMRFENAGHALAFILRFLRS